MSVNLDPEGGAAPPDGDAVTLGFQRKTLLAVSVAAVIVLGLAGVGSK